MTPIQNHALAAVVGGAGFDAAKSDGCTMAPDGWWRSACVTHDAAYYNGGSEADRERADKQLRDDMIRSGAPAAVANLYYGAVRVGGSAGSGLPWRWGFGRGR